jgi:hypothetical protein
MRETFLIKNQKRGFLDSPEFYFKHTLSKT